MRAMRNEKSSADRATAPARFAVALFEFRYGVGGHFVNARQSTLGITSTLTESTDDHQCFCHLGGVFYQHSIRTAKIDGSAVCAAQITSVISLPGIRRSRAKECWFRYALRFHAGPLLPVAGWSARASILLSRHQTAALG